jgi:predicted transcriptional regulator
MGEQHRPDRRTSVRACDRVRDPVPPEPKSEALRALYWREEILQMMFWIKGEGFGDEVHPKVLERFLGVRSQIGIEYLDRLAEEGMLVKTPEGRYSLTDEGHKLGARGFADEFADLTKPGHGECGDDCWCHASPEEAEACAAERLERLNS